MKLKEIIFCFLGFIFTPAFAELKIGTIFYPPYVISNNMGFDIELSRNLCQRLNEKCEFISMKLDELFNALNNGQIDLAIGGMDISSDKYANYIFSLPYLIGEEDFLVLRKNKIKNLAQIKGKKIGVIQNEQEQNSIFFNNYLQSKYKLQFIIVKYNSLEDMLTALISGDISAALIHDKAAHYWDQNGGKQFNVLNIHMLIGNGIAIMAHPKNKILIDKINRHLMNMEQDGTYLKIYNTYFPNK